MRKDVTKRLVAAVLAGTMIMGASLTALASDPGVSGSTGTEGAGSTTGHVNTSVMNVVFPTIPSGSTPFAYIIDPERLIRTSMQYKAADVTLTPSAQEDTGVYFQTAAAGAEYTKKDGLTAETSSVVGLYTREGAQSPYTYTLIEAADTKAEAGKTYYSESNGEYTEETVVAGETVVNDFYTKSGDVYTLVGKTDVKAEAGTDYYEASKATFDNKSVDIEVTNKSSVAVDVSANVKATVGTGETMISLADSSTVSADALELYLGLKVGAEPVAAITADAAGVTSSTKVNGYADNYEYVSKSDGTYTYAMKASPDDSKWSKTKIALTGAVSKLDYDATKKIPTLAVTWTAAAHEAAQPTIASTATFLTGATTDLELATTNLTDASNAKLGETDLTKDTHFTIGEDKLTLDNEVLKDLEAGTYTLTLKGKNAEVTDGTDLTCTITVRDSVDPALTDTAADFTIGSTDDVELATANISEITSVKLGENDLTENTGYTYANDKLTIKAGAFAELAANDYTLTVVAKSADVDSKTLTATITVKEAITDETGTVVVADGVFYVGASSTAGFSGVTAEDVASVTVNGKALTSQQIDVATNATGTWVGAPAASIAAVGEDNGWASGTTWTFVVVVGTTRYTATFTQQ